MSTPAMTLSNTQGNLLASQALAAGASVTFTADFSAKFEGKVQVGATFGTVAATAGLKIEIGHRIGSGPPNDTSYFTTLLIPATASTTQYGSTPPGLLTPGRYVFKLTNLDATNSVSNVNATSDTWDSA